MKKIKELCRNKTLLISGTTLVVGFLLGLLVSRLMMGRRIVQPETPLLSATSSGVGTLSTNQSTNTGNANAEIMLSGTDVVETSRIQVRVNDGVVQWFDGTYWNDVAPTEELQAQDKFHLAETKLAAFEEQYIAEMVTIANNQAEGDAESVAEGNGATNINVGKIKKDPPKTTTTQPAQSEIPATSDNDSGSTNNAGGNSSGATTTPTAPGTGSTTPSTPNTGTTTPSTPDTGTTTPSTPDTGTTAPSTPTETPSDSNTGDGENMEWSDDYL